jgi:hypothetical protein
MIYAWRSDASFLGSALGYPPLWAEEGQFFGPLTEPTGSFCLTGCPQLDMLALLARPYCNANFSKGGI